MCVCIFLVCPQECVLNYRLEPLGTIDGFAAEVGASGTFCPSHMTFPVDVSFYSVSDDNAPSPYMVSRHCVCHLACNIHGQTEMVLNWNFL